MASKLRLLTPILVIAVSLEETSYLVSIEKLTKQRFKKEIVEGFEQL
jgi:hypothetical protein